MKGRTRMRKILLLQHSWEDPKGFVGDLLDERHIPYDVVQVEEETIPDPAQYAAIITLGGPQQAYDEQQYPYLLEEKRVTRQIVAQAIPYLGICLGGQILADALGGRAKPHTMAEVGFYEVQITDEGQHDPLLAGLPGHQKVFHWHTDTFDLPDGAVLLATNSNTHNQAFRYGTNAYGLQYHIELDTAMLSTWLHHPQFEESALSELGLERYQQLEQESKTAFALYHQHTRIMLDNFLSICKIEEGRVSGKS